MYSVSCFFSYFLGYLSDAEHINRRYIRVRGLEKFLVSA